MIARNCSVADSATTAGLDEEHEHYLLASAETSRSDGVPEVQTSRTVTSRARSAAALATEGFSVTKTVSPGCEAFGHLQLISSRGGMVMAAWGGRCQSAG